MSNDKIRISWEEVQSSQVDAKLAQQSALQRAQQHAGAHATQAASAAYPQTPLSPTVASSAAPGRRGLWYNPIFHMAAFGLLGGLLAWGCSEPAWAMWTDPRDGLGLWLQIRESIAQSLNRGELSAAQAAEQTQQWDQEWADNPYVKVYRDASLSDAAKQQLIEGRNVKDGRKEWLQSLAVFSIASVLLATCLTIADSLMSRNWRGTIINGSIGAALGLVGGALVAMFIDRLFNALGGGFDSFGRVVFARAAVWGVLGVFLAIAPGLVLRSWRRLLIGIGGGFLGGFLGGLAFDPIENLTGSDIFSRFVGLTAIGLASGAGTGIIENVAKSGWLRVTSGLIVGKQFVLYKNPTSIGSSPQCEIYLFKDPHISPRHAAIHVLPGGFELEDLHSTTGTWVNGRAISRVRLQTGDQIQISGTAFSFQEKVREAR